MTRERYLDKNPSTDLAPCPLPLCGGPAIVAELNINGAFYKAVRCRSCGLIGPQYLNTDPKAATHARTLWNDRGRR